MANTIILPYSIITNPRTPKRRSWRRHTTTTTMIINTKQKLHSSLSHFVHNSLPNLPDIVNDCEQQINRQALQFDTTNSDHHHNDDDQMKLTCKQIAHSLRLVADQVDKKYCQDATFNQDFHCLSIRLVFHTTHIRTILYTLWSRSFLPFLLLICKRKSFF